MRRLMVVVSVVLCLGLLFAVESRNARASQDRDTPREEQREELSILEFDSMVGVFGAFRGPTNAIRGVPGAGADWKNPRVEGVLRGNGGLGIEVRGLVLVSTGTNPAANFGVIVSCMTVDPTGKVTVANVNPGKVFPATTAGNANIKAKLGLPSPCLAPIVFVIAPPTPARPTGAWFAVTGHSGQEQREMED